MNERIRELLNQATTDALYETKDAIDFLDNPVTKQQRELQLEKFAELIVKECMDVVGKATASPNGYQALMKHFGVEE
jgi:hypothetical protein